jgi:hypothetical protein
VDTSTVLSSSRWVFVLSGCDLSLGSTLRPQDFAHSPPTRYMTVQSILSDPVISSFGSPPPRRNQQRHASPRCRASAGFRIGGLRLWGRRPWLAVLLSLE